MRGTEATEQQGGEDRRTAQHRRLQLARRVGTGKGTSQVGLEAVIAGPFEGHWVAAVGHH
jgi:hypothetical protein